MDGTITPSDFALAPFEQIKYGLNAATSFIGSTKSTNISAPGRLSRVMDGTVLQNDTYGRSVLELAKQRLSSMDFVGITSRFSESMELMSWKLGIPIPRYCACNINMFKPATYEKELKENAKERIKELNCLDMELYDHAERIFEEQIEAYQLSTPPEKRLPFKCNTGNGTCKRPASHGSHFHGSNYFPISKFNKDHAKFFKSNHGYFKSDCSYECSR